MGLRELGKGVGFGAEVWDQGVTGTGEERAGIGAGGDGDQETHQDKGRRLEEPPVGG